MPDLTRPKETTELSLCGCLMLDNSFIGSVVDSVEPSDFYDPKARELYLAIIKSWTVNGSADPASAALYLPPSVPQDTAWEALQMVGSAALTPGFAKQITDASLRRRMYSTAKVVARMAKEDDRDVGTVLGEAQSRVVGVRTKDAVETLDDVIARVQRESEEASKNPSGLRGVSYSIRGVDNVTGGMRPGNLIIVGARSSVGKSALVKSCLVYGHIVGRDSGGCAVFSPEDSREDFVLRMVSQKCGVNARRLGLGDLDREEWARYTDACAVVAEKARDRLLLDDRPRPTPSYIMNACRQWTTNGKPLDFIVIDYLQMMGDIVSGSGYERKSALAYACQSLAKDMGVPVVLVAQLSRNAEGRDGIKAPILTDLKETGALEEAANVVLLLHREDRASTEARLWVAKNKNGPTGDCAMTYHPPTTTFKEA